ncbi:MAG: hypothetical protein ABR511_01390 [Acidimicrobiales bacterium]
MIALAFLAVFSLFLATLLNFAQTGLKVGATVEGQRKVLYSADGAIQTEIRALQPSNGDCASPQSVSSVTLNGQAVSISCTQGLTGTGGSNTSLNTPGKAILTLSTNAGETGINQSSNNNIKVHGGVFSNSNIAVQPSSSITVENGDVKARSGCTGGPISVVTPGFGKDCAFNGTDPTGSDPNYPPATSTLPPVQTVPACSSAVKTIKLLPGTYSDSTALNNLSGGACKGDLIWFSPGVYYFEFSTAAPIWTVSGGQGSGGSVQFVGGTPKGWTYTNPAARPAVTMPGSCATATDPAPNDGVQFIFGGISQMAFSHGNMELCAQPSLTQQQIAIYGLKADVGGMHGQSGCVTAQPYHATGTCALVSAGGSGSGLYVQGTIYTPNAAMDFQQPNTALVQIFGRGLVARVFAIAIQPSNGFTGASISVPDINPVPGLGNPFREAILTASMKPCALPDPQCPTRPWLRAKVYFESGATPPVHVLEWSVLR